MSQELINTSAPRGLRPGSTGFCTVAMTPGISPALEDRLTLLSGYRWLVAPGENGAEKNPVSYAHWRLTINDEPRSVLSRVADAGFDYSRRSNRLAHHVILDPAEQCEPGPAWVMLQPGILRANWTGEPSIIPSGPEIPIGPRSDPESGAWADAAGLLAEAFTDDPSQVAWVIYPPGADVLAFIDQSLSRLAPPLRWEAAFCTYFTDLPAGMYCAWRCCPAETRMAADAQRRRKYDLFIDLTHD
jgi:GTPase-associated protein 1, N-terminal domain type 2/GTPase-associated protein 1, middle domain